MIEKRKEEKRKRFLEKKDQVTEFENETYSYIGNPDAPIKIVMFFDYNCKYCKEASKIVEELIKDSTVKVVYKHLPMLNEMSFKMAKLAVFVAKNNKDKFLDLHHYMINSQSISDEEIIKYIKDNNIGDYESIMSDEFALKSLSDAQDFASHLEMEGVPLFIINDKIYPGFLSLEQLKSILKL